MKDNILDNPLETAIPLDDDTERIEPIRESILIERQWDRVMAAGSKNLLDYQNRAEFKSSVMMLESYLNDILEKNNQYQAERKKLITGEKGSIQEEIKKTFDIVRRIKNVISQSYLVEPEIVDVEDDGTYD